MKIVCAVLLVPALFFAQSAERKSYTLRGTVDRVDQSAGKLIVTNEAIPDGMGAMTMTYFLPGDSATLSRARPGDKITAEYREGELSLYSVRILADDRPGLRLEDLERMAIQNHPTLTQASAAVRAAAGMARQASLYPNPTLGYYADEVRGGYSGGGKQGGFISQTIVTGGKRGAARHTANLALQQAETGTELQRLRVVNGVRSAFYQVLTSRKSVEVHRSLAAYAEDAAATARQLENIGQVDSPDVLQAEVEQQQALTAMETAEERQRASWRILAAAVGTPGLAEAPLAGDADSVPALDYSEWLASTLKQSPELQLAQQDVERAGAALVQARKVNIPDLQLSGNLSQNNEPLDTTHRATGLNGGVQIGMTLPLFNRNQGNISAARAQVETATAEVERLRLRIARDVASSFQMYTPARNAALRYRNEMLPRAEKAYQLYSANYRNMTVAYTQTLLAQRTLFQLQTEYIRLLETAWRAALEIQGFGQWDGLMAPGRER